MPRPRLPVGTDEEGASAAVTFEGGKYGLQSRPRSRGVGVNIGGEYREGMLKLEVDNGVLTRNIDGQGGATLPIDGSFNVKDAFTEIEVPLVTTTCSASSRQSSTRRHRRSGRSPKITPIWAFSIPTVGICSWV